MIRLEDVEKIHEILIERFGGSKGIRDKGILESAINRPYQTFDKTDLYPTTVDKAAAIFESPISNHPFVDGNKRTVYVLMKLPLMSDGMDLKANQDDKYDFVIKSATGEWKFGEIKQWITNNLK